MKIAAAQINTIAGDIEHNLNKIKEYARKAERRGAELVVFPELALSGGFAGDLYLRRDFLNECEEAIKKLSKELELPAVLGSVYGGENAAVLIKDGKAEPVSFKALSGAEKKYFNGNEAHMLANGVLSCIYSHKQQLGHSVKRAAELRAGALIVLANEPFYLGRKEELFDEISGFAKRFSVNIVFVNAAGAQDGIVSLGSSFAVNKSGFFESYARQFEEDLIFADFILNTQASLEESAPEKQAYEALVLGLKDYARKNGFKKFVLGVSGGVDSALAAVIAKDAFGAENITGIFMPSKYTSKRSRDDAEKLCGMNSVKLLEMPINAIFDSFAGSLSGVFKGTTPDLTEENLQSRIRGVLLMAYSNKFNALVLTTGNRSEIAAGYYTLYGDTAGGYAVICDLPKTFLYKLCRWRNLVSPVIPESIIMREPTAELRDNQKDSDSLPEYDILDPVIDKFAASFLGAREISLSDEEKRIFEMIAGAEYKRRQLPLGTKIFKNSLMNINLPVTNGYREK